MLSYRSKVLIKRSFIVAFSYLMDINTTIVFSCLCFHRDPVIGPYEIKKCEIVETNSNEIYHVIYFTKPIDGFHFRNISSIHCHYNPSTLVDEIWENMSIIPINSLDNLSNKVSCVLLNELLTQMIQSICTWSLSDHVSILLKNGKMESLRIFLSSVAAFGRYDNEYRYIYLNRFSLISMEESGLKIKHKALQMQLFLIVDLIKLLLFRKLSSATLKTKKPNKNCSKCKLFGFEERFLGLNTIDLHTLFCQSDGKYNQLEMIKLFYPVTHDLLDKAITYVKGISP